MKRVSLPGEGLVEPEVMRGTHQQPYKGKDQQGCMVEKCACMAGGEPFIPPEEREGVEGDHPPRTNTPAASLSWTLASVLAVFGRSVDHDFRVI